VCCGVLEPRMLLRWCCVAAVLVCLWRRICSAQRAAQKHKPCCKGRLFAWTIRPCIPAPLLLLLQPSLFPCGPPGFAEGASPSCRIKGDLHILFCFSIPVQRAG
jgi:hypothetical protein